MAEGKKYVVYGMRLKCDQGTMENYLSTDVGHGIVYQGQPVMNANDHKEGIHLTHFGDCNSRKVFEEAKKEADEKYKAEEGDGFFTRAGKWLAKTVTRAAVDFKATFMSNKCEPVTPLPWMFTSEDHTIDGAPALMMESRCPCALGGVISIVPVVEEVTEDGKGEEKEENLQDHLLEAFASVINGAKSIGEFYFGMVALYGENKIADIASAFHTFQNPMDARINLLQAICSFMPDRIKEHTGWIRNSDIQEVDQAIRAYEDKIYKKHQSVFEEYNAIRKEQDYLKDLLEVEYLSKEERETYKYELNQLNKQETELFKNISIMDEMISMGNELNTMPAITRHKNDMVNFFNLVYTDNPIDLKSRSYSREGENRPSYSIWSRPWSDGEGGGLFHRTMPETGCLDM